MNEARTYEVDPGDPHNDQMAARVSEDLDGNLVNVRKVLSQAVTQGAARPAALAVIAKALIDQTHTMPRDRLGSLLALAMIRLAEAAESTGACCDIGST